MVADKEYDLKPGDKAMLLPRDVTCVVNCTNISLCVQFKSDEIRISEVRKQKLQLHLEQCECSI
jgi:hypothetical protein